MIHFKDAAMERQLPEVHPEVVDLLRRFDIFSSANKLPEPVVTDLVRDVPSQVRIYVDFWEKLQASFAPGPHHLQFPDEDGTWRALTPTEAKEAQEVRFLSDADLAIRASRRFTWHWAKCAADLRTYHYSPTQLQTVHDWFEKRAKRPDWELLVHDVTAPHLHVARRDFRWRDKYAPSPLKPPDEVA